MDTFKLSLNAVSQMGTEKGRNNKKIKAGYQHTEWYGAKNKYILLLRK